MLFFLAKVLFAEKIRDNDNFPIRVKDSRVNKAKSELQVKYIDFQCVYWNTKLLAKSPAEVYRAKSTAHSKIQAVLFNIV